MAEIINLNRARKAKAKTDAQATAAANKIKYGRSKSSKLAEKLEATRLSRAVDDAKRET
jgi:ApbE superfamily uncharacterized protein (UPF0280 family)